MRSSKVAQYGLFAALAILMGYVEMLIPLPLLVPGMKLGLANVIIVIVLYHMDTKSAFFISLVRVLMSGLLFQGFAGLLYSLAGALLSLAVMALLKKTGNGSPGWLTRWKKSIPGKRKGYLSQTTPTPMSS